VAKIVEYDARLDVKKRLTLRGASFVYYHVQELPDGRIMLDPRELVVPFEVSKRTLAVMDASVENLKKGNVSKPVGLSKFKAG
jgi:hypothetical protein